MIWTMRRKLKRMKRYAENWDTVDYGYVHITPSGKLLPTNNIDLGELCLSKPEFLSLIKFLEA